MATIRLTLSDHLDRELDFAASESNTTKAEVFCKAFELYLKARAAAKEGKFIGLGDKGSDVLNTEFIDL